MIALYKTFSGGEFLEASILSIYKYVEKIVCINSNISWGGMGRNNCTDILEQLQNKYPKLEVFQLNTSDQMYQVYFGLNHISENYNSKWIMLIDSDEIWDSTQLEKAIRLMSHNNDVKAYKTSVYTYVKSCYFRVYPIESLQPVCFVRNKLDDYGENIRCCDMQTTFMNVIFHHYSYVRENFTEILVKLINSHISESQPTIPIDEWISTKWWMLPFCRDFHIAKGFEKNWYRIEITNEIPVTLRNNSILGIGSEYA